MMSFSPIGWPVATKTKHLLRFLFGDIQSIGEKGMG